jgi:hypothetical protein
LLRSGGRKDLLIQIVFKPFEDLHLHHLLRVIVITQIQIRHSRYLMHSGWHQRHFEMKQLIFGFLGGALTLLFFC